ERRAAVLGRERGDARGRLLHVADVERVERYAARRRVHRERLAAADEHRLAEREHLGMPRRLERDLRADARRVPDRDRDLRYLHALSLKRALYNPAMLERSWPAEGATRVPYWVYQDEDIYREEQRRIFLGATWNYLCLEAELAEPGSYITTFVGEMPVVVTRDRQGALHAFENRCAHRGALICMQARGRAERFNCIYHNWTYDHAGNLTNVA